MPNTPHVEQHFRGSELIRDIVIGMSDGLTVPFALAAGLSGASVATGIVVTAGLAEIAAGSIAMGLGGYLAAKTDLEHYITERRREFREIREMPAEEVREVAEVFQGYGLTAEEIRPVLTTLKQNPVQWVDFMMRFELGLETPDPRRAWQSALTIALSYIAGGVIPLSPYIFLSDTSRALWISIAMTLIALFSFGYVKGRFTGTNPIRSGQQTALVGGLSAAAAFLLARMFK